MVHPRVISIAVIVAIVASFLFSCATPPGPSSEEGLSKPSTVSEIEPSFPLVYGRGAAVNSDDAREAALLDGIRRAAETLLGPALAVSSVDKLDRLFSSDASNGSDYYKEGSLENLGTISEMDNQVEAAIRGRIVTLYLVKRLEAAGIGGDLFSSSADLPVLEDEEAPPWLDSFTADAGRSDGQVSSLASLAESAAKSSAAEEKGSVDLGRLDLSSSERQRLTDYITSMKFMVLAADETDKASVDAAEVLNTFLDMRGYSVSSPQSIEALMHDQKGTYEAETGKKIELMQWTADKLRADIALTIDAEVETGFSNGSYSGEVLFRIGIMEASSWKDLGMLRSPRGITVSGYNSEEEASAAVLVRGLTQMLPDITGISEEGVRDMLVKGIPYTVEIININSSAAANQLKDRLKDQVRNMSQSFKNGSLFLEVRYLGGVESLENTLCDAAAAVPGLENISLLYQRGNALTFDVFR